MSIRRLERGEWTEQLLLEAAFSAYAAAEKPVQEEQTA